jgi:hypothetical protein
MAASSYKMENALTRQDLHNYMSAFEKKVHTQMADLVTRDDLHNYMQTVEKKIYNKINDVEMHVRKDIHKLSDDQNKRASEIGGHVDKLKKEIVDVIKENVGDLEHNIGVKLKKETPRAPIVYSSSRNSPLGPPIVYSSARNSPLVAAAAPLLRNRTRKSPTAGIDRICGRGKKCPANYKCNQKTKKCAPK